MATMRITEEQSAKNAPMTCSLHASGRIQTDMAVLIEERWERVTKITSDGSEYLFETESGEGYWLHPKGHFQAGW